MNKKNQKNNTPTGEKTVETRSEQRASRSSNKKLSEYGRQLLEKQKVKKMYGVREKQFKRFFKDASSQQGAPGENLLSLLEQRLDNVLYRLKLAVTRRQARQIITHGHVLVNSKRVYSPSSIMNVGDIISFVENVTSKAKFLEQAIDKRLNIGIKVPEWLELNKHDRKGQVLRAPIRSDIQVPIEEHMIVELFSR